MHVHIHILIHVYTFKNITFAFQSYILYIQCPHPPFRFISSPHPYPPQAYDHPSLEKEVKIMKLVDHPNVMRLFAVYDEPTKAHLGRRPLPALYLLPVHPIPLNSTP